MTARAFNNIGQNIFDYFAPKTYRLDRTLQMKVNADPVEFELEQSMTSDQIITARLKTRHTFPRESLFVETSTDESPEFKVETDRINKLKTTVGFKDPKISTKFGYAQEKINGNVEVGFDWKKSVSDATIDVAYEHGDKFTFGGTVEVSRNLDGQINVCDYGLAGEFRRNPSQIFALKTAEKFTTFQLGSEFGIKAGFTGFAQLDVVMEPKADSNTTTEFAWAVGLQKEINDTSGARFLYRGSDGSGTLAYRAHSKAFEAKLAYNFNVRRLGEPRTIQYKVIFGS